MGLRITSASTKFVVAIVALLAIVLFAGTGSTALAVPLPPGGSVVPGAALPPGGAAHLAGTTQNFASQDAPLNPNGTSYTGSLQSDVWMGYPGNPLGGLTFTYVLANNGPDRLDRLTVSDFTGYGTDVAMDPTVGTVPAVLADRDLAGETVIWQFGNAPGLTAGTSSMRLVVHTNATQFTQSLAGILNGAPASALSFGPSPVPEPATLAGLALLGMGIVARRR
jgi:hypothetical protein